MPLGEHVRCNEPAVLLPAWLSVPSKSFAIYHVHVYTWPSCFHICATVESVFVFRVALWPDERCVCTAHQRMLLIPVFFGLQPESQLSAHPTLTHKYAHTHIRVWLQHLSACPWLPSSLSSWHSLWVGWEGAHTYSHWWFSRGALGGSKPITADGHSWEGLVSLGDIGTAGICVSLCAHVFVKIPVLNHACAPPLSSPLPYPPPLHLFPSLRCVSLLRLSSPPRHALVFSPPRICKPVTHCPSPHRLCQQLFNDGCRSRAKLGQ